MLKEKRLTTGHFTRLLTILMVILVVDAIGTYLLVKSHAATPYATAVASTGTIGNGAQTVQNCVGSSTGTCVSFDHSVPMDGNVALALSNPGTPFSPTSFWNTPLPASITANPNSAAYDQDIVDDLCFQSLGTAPCANPASGALNTSAWSGPLYVVPANQPLVPVSRYNYITDQNTADSNWWTATGWQTGATSATHKIGNTSPLSTTQLYPNFHTTYQLTYTFSGNPTTGSTVDVTLGGTTVADYTFNSAVPSQDNFTDTKTVTTSSNTSGSSGPGGTSGYSVLTFTPSSSFNGTISVSYIGQYSVAFNAAVAGGVPIPADAHGSGETNPNSNDTDKEIQIYQPSADNGQGKYWDFWQFQKGSTGQWEASWGGAIDDVATSDGIFPNNTGATATSLPLIGAMPRIEELQAGQIDHVMGLMLANNLSKSVSPANCQASPPNPALNISGAGISWPATRTDGGSTNACAIPEGQRFRLPPNLNLAQYNLKPVALAIAEAAQKYGFVVYDTTNAVGIRIGDPTTYTVAGLPNPYTSGPGVNGQGTTGLFEGLSASQVMQNFPWNQLQALPFNYGEPTP